jgi:hypothetical protein
MNSHFDINTHLLSAAFGEISRRCPLFCAVLFNSVDALLLNCCWVHVDDDLCVKCGTNDSIKYFSLSMTSSQINSSLFLIFTSFFLSFSAHCASCYFVAACACCCLNIWTSSRCVFTIPFIWWCPNRLELSALLTRHAVRFARNTVSTSLTITDGRNEVDFSLLILWYCTPHLLCFRGYFSSTTRDSSKWNIFYHNNGAFERVHFLQNITGQKKMFTSQ